MSEKGCENLPSLLHQQTKIPTQSCLVKLQTGQNHWEGTDRSPRILQA